MRYFKNRIAPWIAKEVNREKQLIQTMYAAGALGDAREPFRLIEYAWEEISETEAHLLILAYQ